MRRRAALLPLAVMLLAGADHPVPPRELRGKAGAACRSTEPGPAAMLEVQGLKDRSGKIRLELYPANDRDFLAADKELIAAGKPFKRIELLPPPSGPITLCIRAPAAGTYALAIHHDRDGDGKFNFLRDGVGFPNNPKLGTSKPKAQAVAMAIGPGIAEASVRMNYRRGLGFGPVEGRP